MCPTSPSPPGSSPHTRGALDRGDHPSVSARIIPAYAGSTQSSAAGPGRRADHPRIRGEHRWRWPIGPGPGGSSPHTRGARPDPVKQSFISRIIPAYAGSTPTDRAIWSAWSGSSPHTRGAQVVVAVCLIVLRIIPAYAGSTAVATELARHLTGSSPHTRGARAV